MDVPGRVRSVGTLDVGPVGVLEEILVIADARGFDVGGHRAHALRAGELAEADLVIGFEPIHVTTAVVDGGASLRNSFLIVELAERLRLLRGPLVAPPIAEHEFPVIPGGLSRPLSGRSVADPFGGSRADFAGMADEVESLVRQIVGGLFGIGNVIGNSGGRRRLLPRPSSFGRLGLRDRTDGEGGA